MGKYTSLGAILAACLTAGSSAIPPLPKEELVDSRAVFPESDFTQLGFRKSHPTGLVWKRGEQQIFVEPGTGRILQVDTGKLRCRFQLPSTLQLSLTGVDSIFTHLKDVTVPSGDMEPIRLFDQSRRLIVVTCNKSK